MNKRFAVLTCGGVCPGLNDIVRSITIRSFIRGVNSVHGVPYGFQGLHDASIPHIQLSPSVVRNIHTRGGTYLGTSRIRMDPALCLHALQLHQYDALFVVGGNGGNAAAHRLHEAAVAEGISTQILALPKSIDNDIDLIDRCFGFHTAVSEAAHVLRVARNEADAVPRGITIVKLMGRESGFIAAHASKQAGHDVDICLIPERPSDLETIVSTVTATLSVRGSCVICIAEGFAYSPEFIRDELTTRMEDSYIKYIDPSYLIRGGRTTSFDHAFCTLLGSAAVDAALQGHSGITVATKNDQIHYFNTVDVIQKVRKYTDA